LKADKRGLIEKGVGLKNGVVKGNLPFQEGVGNLRGGGAGKKNAKLRNRY